MARTQQTPTAQRTVNGTNVLLVVVGLGMLVASLNGLLWYSVDAKKNINVAGTGFTFADLQSNTKSLVAPVAGAYFDWLAWTLIIAVGVVGLAANLPTPLTDGLRVAGFLLGLLGAVLTYYSLAQLFRAQQAAGASTHSVLHNSSFGTWGALGGFAVAAVGAGLGPRRAR